MSNTRYSNGAREYTPESEPQANGTSDEWIGNQVGVGPCSPERFLPRMCRIPSYSRKYNAVPKVSRTAAARSKSTIPLREKKGWLTKMQTKASVESCNAIVFEDVPYRFDRIGRFSQGDTLTVGNNIFQLPPDLEVASGQG